MFTMEGERGTAACYATNIASECVDQIKTMLDMPFAEDTNTAIMPDVHFGLGCTIGTTMKGEGQSGTESCWRGYWLRDAHGGSWSQANRSSCL